MPERFVEWRPAGLVDQAMWLVSLHDDRAGLVLRFEGSGRTIELAFGVVVAFRSTLEECCVEYWAQFRGSTASTWPYLIVEASAWLATFSEADLCLHPGAKHYMIVTDDERIDVITSRVPVARILDSR